MTRKLTFGLLAAPNAAVAHVFSQSDASGEAYAISGGIVLGVIVGGYLVKYLMARRRLDR